MRNYRPPPLIYQALVIVRKRQYEYRNGKKLSALTFPLYQHCTRLPMNLCIAHKDLIKEGQILPVLQLGKGVMKLNKYIVGSYGPPANHGSV